MSNFEQMLESRIPRLRRYAWVLSKDTTLAEDLVQETLLKAWGNREKFLEGTNLDAWLSTILRNNFFSYYRRNKLIDVDSDGTALAKAKATTNLDAAIAMRECGEEIDKLPAAQREALLMVTVAGASYEEAAGRIGCSTGTIKSRINRARNRLMESR